MIAWLKKIDRALFPDLLVEGLRREMAGMASGLDVGCGAGGPLLKVPDPAELSGLDAHAPSLEKLRGQGRYTALIHQPIFEAEFASGQFEAVAALDVIEHFEKLQALELIRRMELWASKKIILATPNGFLAQGVYDENPHQVHRSGFSAAELRRLGYRVRGFGGPKWLRGAYAELRFWPKPLWHRISGALQPLTWIFPGMAFGLFAVKDK
jgi:SAM-dependent methyltransferase